MADNKPGSGGGGEALPPQQHPQDVLFTSSCADDLYDTTDASTVVGVQEIRWAMLGLIPLIGATAFGNILVGMAVVLERRLQNMNNYFLMSLAIADLLVAVLVMPVGLVVEMYGKIVNYILMIDY